jgi:hypothetical protein
MPRQASAAKRQQWAKRLERFDRSQLTVSQFCKNEGVSVPAFYHWRRQLGGARQPRLLRRERRPATDGALAPGFKPLWLTAAGQPTAATIRLPGGIVVELGPDPQIIEQVLNQVLAHRDSAGTDPC